MNRCRIRRTGIGALLGSALMLALGCQSLQPVPVSRTDQKVEPTTEPLLRLETGRHMAMIGRVATDAAGRWAVTASDDKTARVWEVASGRHVRVLRPPQNHRDEGKVYAVALSPDSAIIALGGWTGLDWDGKASIYLFDRVSGRLLRPS